MDENHVRRVEDAGSADAHAISDRRCTDRMFDRERLKCDVTNLRRHVLPD